MHYKFTTLKLPILPQNYAQPQASYQSTVGRLGVPSWAWPDYAVVGPRPTGRSMPNNS